MTMRAVWCGILWAVWCAAAESPGGALWNALKAKREALPASHQEFEVTRRYSGSGLDHQQEMRWLTIVDIAGAKWREMRLSGSGKTIRIFDGADLLSTETGSEEFVRTKRQAKDEPPRPVPYGVDADWSKAVEVGHEPCGLAKKDRPCIALEARMKPWSHSNNNRQYRGTDGAVRAVIDSETGLLFAVHTSERVESSSFSYVSDAVYISKWMSLPPVDEALFRLPPAATREVKLLSGWDAARMRKELVGKPAPELLVSSIGGATVHLEGLKGKTVLLDFWTTWCPPCRADAPALDRLFRKYGARDLAIVGISIDEDRKTVQEFLVKNPHEYPIVLSTENELPRPFQVGVFPTYVVIDKDGKVAAAMEGDQGFGDLKRALRKAGLEVD
jgi:cytochrome c biogenesis protein CcmG, thiol:disulfide interchange protein DsbE